MLLCWWCLCNILHGLPMLLIRPWLEKNQVTGQSLHLVRIFIPYSYWNCNLDKLDCTQTQSWMFGFSNCKSKYGFYFWCLVTWPKCLNVRITKKTCSITFRPFSYILALRKPVYKYLMLLLACLDFLMLNFIIPVLQIISAQIVSDCPNTS